MGRIDSQILDSNDNFPPLSLQLVDAGQIILPEATGEGYGVVLFYRGYW